MTVTHRPLGPHPTSTPSTGIRLLDITPFVLVHLALLGCFWTGVKGSDFIALGIIYLVQMTAVTVGYHRYFSHKTFRTGRVFQFLLAFLAQTTAQKGVLWWAAHHRDHHRHSDTPRDVHSPVVKGFAYAHVGWLFDRRHDATKLSKIRDFARFRELRVLNRFHLAPAILVGWIILQTLGTSTLLLGFLGSIVLCWHVTFFINSLAHVWGTRTYETSDQSRNNALLALLSCGEGWHNNHHHDMLDARLGTRWWQIDTGWYTIWFLSKLRIVRDPRRRVFHRRSAPPTRAHLGMPLGSEAALRENS